MTTDVRPTVADWSGATDDDSEPPVKAIYLARRHPELTRAGFTARWRRHAALAMSLPIWRLTTGYLHADVDPDPPGAADHQHPTRWSGEFDGVGTVVMGTAAQFAAFHAHPSYGQLRNDEYGTFSALVEQRALMTHEWPVLLRPGPAVQVFGFLVAAPGVGQDEFNARWATHAGLVMQHRELTDLLSTYVQNRSAMPEGPARAPGTFGEVAGIVQLGFASAADRETYLAHPLRGGLAADLAAFTVPERTILVATNRVPLVLPPA